MNIGGRIFLDLLAEIMMKHFMDITLLLNERILINMNDFAGSLHWSRSVALVAILLRAGSGMSVETGDCAS